MIRLSAVALGLLAFAWPAGAHPLPFSYLDVRPGPGGLAIDVTVHVFDAAHDLGVAPAESLLEPATISVHAAALRSLLAARLQVSGDGRTLSGTWSGPEGVPTQSSLRFHVVYPSAQPVGRLAVAADLAKTNGKPVVSEELARRAAEDWTPKDDWERRAAAAKQATSGPISSMASAAGVSGNWSTFTADGATGCLPAALAVA